MVNVVSSSEVSHHDLSRFGLREMIECGRSIRDLDQSATSMESAATLLVSHFRKTFIDLETQQPDCSLVRVFKTHRFGQLPTELKRRAEALIAGKNSSKEELSCLTLLATSGDLAEWNDRSHSAGHAVIPLENIEVVEQAPMISQLIRQMGIDIGSVISPSEELLLQADERAYGVFHVEKAAGSSSIPSQQFISKHKIQSVLGFGGLFPSGDLFAMIMFSRKHISRETADLFRTIALSVKLFLLPFTRGPVFEHEPAPNNRGKTLRSYEQGQMRSEIATLRLLIPALEKAAMHQTNRLEDVVVDLRTQAEEVRKLGARLGSVLESTTNAVFMLDRAWNFTYLNSHAHDLLQTGSELLGRNIWQEFPAAVDRGFWKNYHTAMDERIPTSFEEHYPEPLDRWFEVHAFPNEEGIAVFLHDVTDRRRANAALIKNEKLAAVGRLAASIAHEINNPLESVTNLLYLAKTTSDVSEIQNYLATADRELRRVGAITNQTLRFHKQSSKPTLVRSADLIDDVLSIYQGRIVNSRVQIVKRTRSCREILCYEGEIRQVLSNLVANAIDALHPDGGSLHLRAREGTDWKSGRKGLVITVADTGAGMPPHIQSKSFEPFFTTKDIGGTGLGLWISAGIVDRHLGRLSLRSSQRDEHKGTVFVVFLPYPGPEC